METKVWILENTDKQWNGEFVQERVLQLVKDWGVQIADAKETRDRGYGQERLFIVSGEPEKMEGFECELLIYFIAMKLCTGISVGDLPD